VCALEAEDEQVDRRPAVGEGRLQHELSISFVRLCTTPGI
jgi:hypothetical protein